ncbi:unnamed protein product [Heligmosomoides polygyrus]|uniref:Rib_recp_KP_reg domain-containing protein n=1 Tax=Heligmosomoides polygyrus TaxID=6339 RepID=A0A3P8DWP2_HELPZ|nr:unnamed protein product [Heligmosomoides polygyrus]
MVTFAFRNGSDGPGMRNLPLFAFLAGLVFFFYVFYVYQTQSAELSSAQSSLDANMKQIRVLKVDLLNAKAENERLKASEASMKGEKDRLAKDFDACTSSVRTCKLNADRLEKEKKNFEEESRKKDEEKAKLQAEVDQLKIKVTGLEGSLSQQEESAKKAKEEFEKLENELKQLKASGANAAVDEKEAVSQTVQAVQGVAKPVADKSDALVPAPIPNIPVPAVQANAQAPPPVPAVKRSAGDLEKKDEMQVPEPPKQPGALIDPPRQPGDRVKLAVAEEERQQQDRVVDKPIVKGGDYDDKLDLEKAVDDVQSA